MRPFSETSRRSGRTSRTVLIAYCAATLCTLFAPAARAQQFDYDPDGYWKMPSPPATKGEFDGEDPIGLASRQHIPTDCAINWKDDAGKTYCFASSMSAQVFQDERTSILAKATAFWAKEHTRKLDAPTSPKPGAPEPSPQSR